MSGIGHNCQRMCHPATNQLTDHECRGNTGHSDQSLHNRTTLLSNVVHCDEGRL